MSVQLYHDEHVRSAVTEGLRKRGVDVLTAQEDGAAGTSDPALLDHATALGRVVFTQDEDFLVEAHLRQHSGQHFAGVIYAHQLNVTIGKCIEDLELIAKVYEPEDLVNRVEYLPLK
jgi:predicted nuclease of predicted toxin-antitoxin system